MASNLEGRQGEGGIYDLTGGVSNAMSKSRNCILEGGENGRQPAEEKAKKGDKGELYHGKGCGFREGVEDGFGRCIRKST